MIADIKRVKTALDALGVPYRFEPDENPPVFTLHGAGGDLIVALDTPDELYDGWFRTGHFGVPYGKEDGLIETLTAIVRGEIEVFGVYVGNDCRITGFCERVYLPQMAQDFAGDIDLIGAELRLHRFDSAEEESMLLSEIDA